MHAGLAQIDFGPVWSLVRVPPIANSLPEEMPVYTQLKIGFTIYVHLKVPHDTPPLRGFGLLVSRVLELWISWSSNLVFHKPGFRPLLAPISPGWTPGLGSFLGKSSVDFSPKCSLWVTSSTPLNLYIHRTIHLILQAESRSLHRSHPVHGYPRVMKISTRYES